MPVQHFNNAKFYEASLSNLKDVNTSKTNDTASSAATYRKFEGKMLDFMVNTKGLLMV